MTWVKGSTVFENRGDHLFEITGGFLDFFIKHNLLLQQLNFPFRLVFKANAFGQAVFLGDQRFKNKVFEAVKEHRKASKSPKDLNRRFHTP